MPRVRRISDGTIFSSASAVAYATENLLQREVAWCCDGYMQEVYGEQYEWVFEKAEDKTLLPDISYYKRIGKFKNIRGRGQVRFMLEPLRIWLRETKIGAHSVPMGRFFTSFKPFVDEYWKFDWNSNARSLSRHFRAWEPIYKKLVGLRLSKHYSQIAHREVFHITFDEPEFPDADYDIDVLEDQMNNRGRPVVRLNDAKIFISLSAAAKYTSISAKYIMYCCEGDIPGFAKFDLVYRFMYLKDIEMITNAILEALIKKKGKEKFLFATSKQMPRLTLVDSTYEPHAIILTGSENMNLILLHPDYVDYFVERAMAGISETTVQEFVEKYDEFKDQRSKT